MTISTPQGNIQVNVLDESYRYRQLMGENYVELKLLVPEYIEVPVGSTIALGADVYTLLEPQVVLKHSSRKHEISLRFEGVQASMRKYMYRDVNGTWGLKFSLTAKLSDHLNLLIANLNEREGGWSYTLNHEDLEKTITVSHNYIYDVLGMITEAYATEYEIIGKNIIVGKVEYFKEDPLQLSYGKGNGFKSGVKRENRSNQKQVDVLFVQGGDRNIVESEYGSRYLRMPPGAVFEHLGEEFEVDEFGYSIHEAGKNIQGATEDSIDLSEIYPKFEGTVGSVTAVDPAKNFYDFVDTTIPDALDFGQLIIAGEKPLIIFQSGGLAGKEFEFSEYIHSTRTFKVVPQIIDGFGMPDNGAFKIQPGNKYIVVNIKMPPAYIADNDTKTGASWDMAREAARNLKERKTPRFSFIGDLDGVWASEIIDEVPRWAEISPKIKVGGHIDFSDTSMESEGVIIRITGIKDYLNKPTYPQIELSNISGSKSLSSVLNKIDTETVVTKKLNDETIRFAKRGFREAKETSEALNNALLNFSGAINPVTINTMQVLLGDPSLQFNFVSNTTTPVVVPHEPQYNPSTKIFNIPLGIIQHKTLGISDVKPNRPASEYRYWTMPVKNFDMGALDSSKYYYLYASCLIAGTTGEFILSAIPKALTEGSNYNLLVGIINSEYEEDRSYVKFYGFTEILPGRITVDKLVSSDGNTYFNMMEGEIGGNIKFLVGGTFKDVFEIIGGIKIGGRNLIKKSSTLKAGTTNSSGGLIFDEYHSLSEELQVGTQYTFSYRKISGIDLTHVMLGDDNLNALEYIPVVGGKATFVCSVAGTVKLFYIGPQNSAYALSHFKMEKGQIATDWTPAPEDIDLMIAQVEEDVAEAISEAQAANESIFDLNTYVDNAFRDGVIKEAEAKAIEKYINEINASKERVYREYQDLYTNEYLTGTAKTNLLNAKVTLFGQIDALLASIQTAIADGATTPAEKADVDAKYASYTSSLGSYTSAVTLAGKAIQNKLNELALKAIFDLEIGGENLYNGNNTLSISSPGGSTPTITRNTVDTPNGFEIVSSSGGNLTEARISNVVRSNGHYVVSCQIRVTSGSAQVNIDICDNHASLVDVDTNWKLIQAVANVGNYSENIYNFVDLQTTNYCTIQVKNFMVQKGNKATDFRKSTEFLMQALEGSTDVLGGILLTNVLLLKNQVSENTGGLSGLTGDNVASWFGGSYPQALADAEKPFRSEMTTGGLDKKDGSGHRAFGKIAWDALGNPFFAGIIEALAGAKIGGMSVFDNTLMSQSMSFSETPVETLAQLMTPSSVSISQISSWSDTGINEASVAQSQPITITFDSQLRFKASCYPSLMEDSEDRRWLVMVQSNGNTVYQQSGTGSIENQLFVISIPAGTYTIKAMAMTTPLIGESHTNESSITGESGSTIYATGYSYKNKIGNDGLYSFWNTDKYIYFKSDYGFEGRYGNIGLRFITGQSSPQKMVSGSWSNL